ncbi:MAG: VWA domain-containing protein [Proteobacteria bacterium]|nr:VWA domain-containing protein [Pseudomonadota bacterium]
MNTIGHGGGGGSGSGYGRGSGSGYGRGSGGLGGTAVPYSYLNDSQKVYWPGHNTETYDHFKDNPFWDSVRNPLSTFSIDVDTASYSNIRRFLNENTLPPKDAIRIEEMINYFAYGYEPPQGPEPFSVHTETAICPWNQDNTLLRIGIKGHEIHKNERPPVNLVFLIDVSGSMTPSNKLPLIKQSLKMLVHELSSKDRISIVVYAGSSGLVLPPTTCSDKRKILDAVYNLEAGGSTNGGQGIRLAYKTAAESFIKHGVNRVILATDGDFNVGVTNQGDLIHLIEEKAKSSVFLTALGFGMGNFKDSTLEKLADRGNGNYSYIDSIKEAKKVLVDQMGGTLFAIAKDVKIQIEFNPTKVGAYRLIGYENRILAAKDFNDDKKDAGEIGSGHVVTALYELVPSGGELGLPSVDPLKYQRLPNMSELASGNELLTLKLRYKDPDGDKSMLIEIPVEDDSQDTGEASHDFKFAAAVAGFGMLLRESPHKGSITFQAVLDLANRGLDWDKNGYRSQFVELVEKARKLRNKTRSEPGKV